MLLFSVMFSSNIVSYMTKTKHSEFENVKFSIKNSEMNFDNFVVNGKSLGKGRATVGVVRTGLFNLVPKLTLSNLKLEDVNLDGIYKEKSSHIDTFTDKINSLTTQEKADKSTADFIKETTNKVTTLTTNTDNFINSKLRENIEKVNVLKQDYVGLTDLKSKAQKIVELNNEIKPLAKAINVEKENIEKNISEIEMERNIALTNISDNLTKLEKEISLNDFNNINSNNNAQNMNLYIFLDKGKDLETSLNTALKATALIKEIKDLNMRISDININDGKIVARGLDGSNVQVNGEVLLENNAKSLIKGLNNGYEITYNNKNLNHTVLTDEEKTLLTQKIENLRNNNYQQIMTKYEEDNKNIEALIDNVYVQKNKLDKLQKDLLSLGTIIKFEQPTNNAAAENNNQTNNSTINILNNSNNNTDNNIKNQNENQNSSKINIGNR